MAKRPAGGEYHNPPLFLLEEADRMPLEVRAWIKSLKRQEVWIAEFQLNLVGVDNFVEHWEYQQDYVAYMINL